MEKEVELKALNHRWREPSCPSIEPNHQRHRPRAQLKMVRLLGHPYQMCHLRRFVLSHPGRTKHGKQRPWCMWTKQISNLRLHYKQGQVILTENDSRGQPHTTRVLGCCSVIPVPVLARVLSSLTDADNEGDVISLNWLAFQYSRYRGVRPIRPKSRSPGLKHHVAVRRHARSTNLSRYAACSLSPVAGESKAAYGMI